MSLHQPGEIFRLLVAELEHDLDLAIREHAYIRRILFREEPVQAFTLLEDGLPLGLLLTSKLLTCFYFFLVFRC